MTIREIYEKISHAFPIEQRIFFNYLNDSINEVAGLYGDMPDMVFGGNITAADIVPVRSLDDEMIIQPLYRNAIVDNILFLCGQGEMHKSDFVRKAREAYLHYWNIKAKNRRTKRQVW